MDNDGNTVPITGGWVIDTVSYVDEHGSTVYISDGDTLIEGVYTVTVLYGGETYSDTFVVDEGDGDDEGDGTAEAEADADAADEDK